MLHLRLLGSPEALWQGEVLSLKGRQWALLGVLALGGGLSRREVAELLWDKNAAQNLRQALYLLRRLPGAKTWLLDGERPALYAEVDALAPTLEALRAPLLRGLPDDLPPAFWEWLALERQRLEELRRERLWQAAQNQPEQALGYLYELIQLDPLHESAVREAMRLESRAGRVQAAWQLYENLRQSLWQELGVEPLAATQAQAALLQSAVLDPLAQRLWEARSLYAEEVRPEFWAMVLEEEPYAVARAWAELEAAPPPSLLPKALRRHLCRRIALALEAQRGEPSATARYWLWALEPERAYPHLLAAGRLALQQGKPNEAQLAFFQALWVSGEAEAVEAILHLSQLAEQQSNLALLDALVERLGVLARRTQSDPIYFEHHQRRAGLRLRQGRPQEAALEALEALEVARRLCDGERISLARLSLGAAHLVAGALEEARPHLEAAARAQSSQTRLRALSNLGALFGLRGEYEASEASFEEALTLARREGQLALAGSLLQNLAATTLRLGRYAQATKRFTEAIELSRSLGDARTETTSYRNLGYLYFLQGQFGPAWNTLEEALELARPLGPGLQAQVLLVQVELLSYLAVYPEAEGRLEEASRLAQAAQDERLLWACRYNRALLGLWRCPEETGPIETLLPSLREARLGDLAMGAEFDLLALGRKENLLERLLACCRPQTPVQHLAWQMGALRLSLLRRSPDPEPLARALALETLCLSVPAHRLLGEAHAHLGQHLQATAAVRRAQELWQSQLEGLPRSLR
ncbi:MAG: hypothetical protein KatS3mg073_0827 [Meiothermus sp.]|nr:MAG: hypothetical protein KatS3mg073_0827 [Meiothermus sp.]